MKIIITDLQFRKSFDIYNICKNKGFSIIGFFTGKIPENIILNLIYLKRLRLLNKNKDFKSDIFKITNKYKYDDLIYIPVEEDTTILFYDLIEKEQVSNIYYSLPPKSSFDLVRNKRKFSNFCFENNFPIPMEYNYDELIKNSDIPNKLIIKPKVGAGALGIKFVNTFKELLQCKDLDFDNYIIQERLDNPKDVEGAFFLFDKGRPISYYGHKRIRTYPLKGGVTVYSKCEINEELKKLGTELLEKLNWSGIAMVEFLYDNKTNSYKIIEVNPRAWGSIMLSEFCGSNIIENYIRISISKEPIESKIKEETYIRWFFPWDVISYIKYRGKIIDFWHFNTDKTCYINFTYSTRYRSIMFLIYNIFDPKKISKLFKKVLKN